MSLTTDERGAIEEKIEKLEKQLEIQQLIILNTHADIELYHRILEEDEKGYLNES